MNRANSDWTYRQFASRLRDSTGVGVVFHLKLPLGSLSHIGRYAFEHFRWATSKAALKRSQTGVRLRSLKTRPHWLLLRRSSIHRLGVNTITGAVPAGQTPSRLHRLATRSKLTVRMPGLPAATSSAETGNIVWGTQHQNSSWSCRALGNAVLELTPGDRSRSFIRCGFHSLMAERWNAGRG